jgi:hypothetical protein
MHAIPPVHPIPRLVRSLNFFLDPFCEVCWTEPDGTLDMEARDKASLGHLVDMLWGNTEHFCYLRNFQGFLATFQYLDKFH